jgi:hypothetical protein
VIEFLKGVAGKVVAGAMALFVIIGAISWWQLDPVTRQGLISYATRILIWMGVVVVLPWVSVPVIGWVARRDSNTVAGIMVAAYTLPLTVLLAWLFNWPFETSVGWTCILAGGLFAALYNIFVCDWIAEKI